MKLTIGDTAKPKKTVRIPPGTHTFDVQWIGETDAPPDFAEGYLLRVPLRCSLTYDIKAGKKYDVTVVAGRVSLYEYEATKLTGARHHGSIVESCQMADAHHPTEFQDDVSHTWLPAGWKQHRPCTAVEMSMCLHTDDH